MRQAFKYFRLMVCVGTVSLTLLASSVVFASVSVEGDVLPSISLPDVDTNVETDVGKELSGKVGAIVYMQTSCAVCRRELRFFNELSSKYDFKVIAISVDADSPERVVKYKEHFGFKFNFLQDKEFTTPGLFGFAYTPALVLVDKNGKIALLKGGFRPGDDVALEEKISGLVGK